MIQAFGILKKAAARANGELGELPPEQLRRIGGCLVVAGGVILWALAR